MTDEPWKPGEWVILSRRTIDDEAHKIQRVTPSGRAVLAAGQFTPGYGSMVGARGWDTARIRRPRDGELTEIAARDRARKLAQTLRSVAGHVEKVRDPAALAAIADHVAALKARTS